MKKIEITGKNNFAYRQSFSCSLSKTWFNENIDLVSKLKPVCGKNGKKSSFGASSLKVQGKVNRFSLSYDDNDIYLNISLSDCIIAK